MSFTITQVDAFASEPFGGNPAAVCLLPGPADPSWMQRVAREMNLSETAFLVRRDAGGFDLRWFTPAVEVELCGHATLASAHALWEEGHLAPDAPAGRDDAPKPAPARGARPVGADQPRAGINTSPIV